MRSFQWIPFVIPYNVTGAVSKEEEEGPRDEEEADTNTDGVAGSAKDLRAIRYSRSAIKWKGNLRIQRTTCTGREGARGGKVMCRGRS